eukprot:scaffold76327_cov33-Tisochrysis_lutea.AAC.5
MRALEYGYRGQDYAPKNRLTRAHRAKCDLSIRGACADEDVSSTIRHGSQVRWLRALRVGHLEVLFPSNEYLGRHGTYVTTTIDEHSAQDKPIEHCRNARSGMNESRKGRKFQCFCVFGRFRDVGLTHGAASPHIPAGAALLA